MDLALLLKELMEAILLALIQQLNASVFVLIAVLIVMFYVVYKVGCWSTKFSNFDTRVKDIESLSEKVIRISTMVEMIYRHIHPNAPARESSPISLTPVGEEIAQKIKAQEILNKYIDTLVEEVEKTEPKNAYDVQQFSFSVARTKLLGMLNEQELVAVKNEAYQRGLLIEDILSVIAILLRNHILDMKKMPISEVDTHTPAIKTVS